MVTRTNALFVLGAAAVAVSASIHLHLWLDGYSAIATIGPLFLLQAISGYGLALALVAFRRLLVAVAGAGFLIATLVAFMLSVNGGLFGFEEQWSAPFATVAFVDEALGAAVLLLAVLAVRSSAGTRGSTTSRTTRSRPSPRAGTGGTRRSGPRLRQS
jgi:hypothetical protein